MGATIAVSFDLA